MRPAGLVVLTSPQHFEDAVAGLISAIAELNIRLVSRFDHTAAATDTGLRLRPITVLTLEDPSAGASLVDVVPTIAVDLPLRMVVWAERDRTMIAYTDPHWLAQRHGEPASQNAVIRGIAAMLATVARAAMACRTDPVGGQPRPSPADSQASVAWSPSCARDPSCHPDDRVTRHRANRGAQDEDLGVAIGNSGADD
jgi:uncharacterized protein (DUF302 family)